MWQALTEAGMRDIVDMGVVAIGLYGLIVWLKQARAGLAVAGMLGLGAIYLVAREYRLELTARMLQSFFAVFVIIVAVTLQGDLRRLFERISRWRLRTGGPPPDGAIDTLAEALCALAGRRCGALVVLPGRDPVERYVEGGTALHGRLSLPLLLSLFDPGSPGHDGAVLLDGDSVRTFGTHLPLSNNFDELRERGTRHSAALGLVEATDALVLVVSEERGEVAVAHQGRMRTVEDTPSEVAAAIRAIRQTPASAGARPFRVLRHRWADAVVATVLAVTLWTVLISGTQVSTKVVRTPVLVNDVRTGYELDRVEPGEVDVILVGIRRDLYLLDPTTVTLRIDGSSIAPDGGPLRLRPEHVRRPDEVSVREITPAEIHVHLRPAPPSESAGPAPPADTLP
jgi:DNA integrity scanning protein DisA with diadenylate cyclase activity